MDILDFCAAPGGKSWQMSRLSKPNQRIFMYEHNAERRNMIEENPLFQLSPGHLLDEVELDKRSFDAVLIDVPCSNSGVLSRSPEAIRHFWHERDSFREVQEGILQRVLGLIRPGGQLFYATCSIANRENSGRVIGFMHEKPLILLKEMQSWPKINGEQGAYLAMLGV